MGRRGMRALLACGLLALSPVVAAPPAAAAVTECVGTPPEGITVPGSLTVPLGEFCSLHQATVLGSVTVYGSLFMEGGTVEGSVTGYDAQVGLLNVEVGNSLVAVRPRAKFFIGPSVLLCGSTLGGSATVRDAVHGGASSIGGPFCASGNTISGGVYLLNNTVAEQLFVWHTTVGGNIVCHASAPPDLQGNTVSGAVLNACA